MVPLLTARRDAKAEAARAEDARDEDARAVAVAKARAVVRVRDEERAVFWPLRRRSR
jgi:hypothetical protein